MYQHKDTTLPSTPCGAVTPVHAWNCAKGADLVYDTSDDCPHCSTCCAPASIAMVAKTYGKTGTLIEQDSIYENGSAVEGAGDGILDTHGVGLYDRPTPDTPPYGLEVQEALKWALGVTTLGQYDSSSTPLDHSILKSLIENNRPALRLDHGGWPANQCDELPPLGTRQYMGHAKVIAGYDDQDTPDPADDLCFVYDPWLSYNDVAKLPLKRNQGATEYL